MSTPVDLTHSSEFPFPHPVLAGPDNFIYGSSSSSSFSFSAEEPAPKRRAVSTPLSEPPEIARANDTVTHITPTVIRRDQAAIDLESVMELEDTTSLDDYDDTEVEIIDPSASTSHSLPIPKPQRLPSQPKDAPLATYTCPICFSAPKDAALTPCGHIMCGSCLFGAVRAARGRALQSARPQEAEMAYCPVCRALLSGWDDRGGGVIGLEIKVKTS